MTSNQKLIFLSIFLLYFLFRVPALGFDIANTDAYRWHDRGEDFLAALKSGNFKSTYQHYQPGVTLMWLNAFVKQATFSVRFHIIGDKNPPTLENADWFPVVHMYSKLIIVLVLGSVLFVQLRLLTLLFGVPTAMLYGFLLSVEPYMVGIDRWFHLTSLETYFTFTAILLVLTWHKVTATKYLAYSGIFLGLAVLSKITSVLVLPAILYVIVVKSKPNWELGAKQLSVFVLSFTATLFILFPALVTHFSYVVQKIAVATTEAVSNSYRFDQLTSFTRLFFYDLVFLYKLSPITLFVLGWLLINMHKIKLSFYFKFLLGVFFVYYLFLTLAQQKIDRYAIVLFPYLLLLLAYFLSTVARMQAKLIVLGALINIAIVTYVYFPVYSAYYSPLVGGTESAISQGVYDNSGEYFAQAAFYLNTKGRDITVYIPNGKSSFRFFFKGTLVNQADSGTDYVVASYDLTRTQLDTYGCTQLDKAFGSREKAVVFVYNCML